MTEDFRKFLIFVKKKFNEDNKKFNFQLLLIILGCLLISLTIDIIFKPNMIINTIRAILVILEGTSLFSFLYVNGTSNFAEGFESFRKDYSYTQRINISIIIMVVFSVLFTLFIKNTSPLYTNLASILFAIFLLIITFIRPTKEEYVLRSYGLKDRRDIAHDREVEEREKQFKEFKKNKEEKNNKKD